MEFARSESEPSFLLFYKLCEEAFSTLLVNLVQPCDPAAVSAVTGDYPLSEQERRGLFIEII